MDEQAVRIPVIGDAPFCAETVFELPRAATAPVIGVGAELKNSLCLIQGGRAWVAAATGDLADAAHYRRFLGELDGLVAGLRGRECILAHDLHPAYLSSQAARAIASRTPSAVCVAVQHHHAHVAACLAENGLAAPAIGIACDGTGYGTDGAIWGCEVLLIRPGEFTRCAHLEYFALPGGDAAARQTWRPALSLVRKTFGEEWPAHVRRRFARVPDMSFRAVIAMLQRGFNCPDTSSLGRLFDAVAFLAGVCDCNDVEARAAVLLEEAAKNGPDEPYPFRIVDGGQTARLVVTEMIAAICSDVDSGVSPGVIAARFHATVAEMLSQAALAAAERHGADAVALTGGCFLNRILADKTERLLRQGGVGRVIRHARLSPGDASLSLGQAYAAVSR